MNRTIFAKSVARRTVLAGVGAGVLGSLLRPLQAEEAMGVPKRLLIVHRPCGTVLEKFFPAVGDAKNFELSPILQSFAPLKNEMIILNGITCPRDTGWKADQHAAALITMMSGKKFVNIPNTDATGDANAKNIIAPNASIDQQLLATVAALQAPGSKGSIQSTAYGPSSTGLPSFKVMSYSGAKDALNGAMFPVSDAGKLFTKLFVNEDANLSPEQIMRKQAQNKGVMDRVHADLTRLQGLIPASQKPKLDAHLAGIQALEQQLQGSNTGTTKMCTPPTQAMLPVAPAGVTPDEARHLVLAQNQLSIIQTAFQCDLTRVATFTFAHGNSDLRFNKIDKGAAKGDGHHGVSHDTSAASDQERIDQLYCEQLSAALQKFKMVQMADGTNLLDNTLVVFFNECAIGNTHSIDQMPVLMLGGKMLKLQTGQHLVYKNRYMNDVWAAVAGAFGAPATFGDPAFGAGPITNLFG